MGVIPKLTEEGISIIAEEDIGADLKAQMIAGLVMYMRPQIGILVRRGIIPEK